MKKQYTKSSLKISMSSNQLDNNKYYCVTVIFPSGIIFADKYGTMDNVVLYNFHMDNGVYVGTDAKKNKRRFNSRCIIDYFEVDMY